MDENPYRAPLPGENDSPKAKARGVRQWLVRNDILRVHITLVCGCVGIAGAAAINMLAAWPNWIAMLVAFVSLVAIAEGVWKIDS